MAALLAGGVLLWRRRARDGTRASADEARVEREFRNVFAMTSRERQEVMIKGLMERRRCSRVEAMRLAVEERRHAR